MSGFQKKFDTLNVLSAYNSWTIQTDVGCFSEGMMSLGCVIKEPNANIFLVASNRFSSHAYASTTEVLAIRWTLHLAKDLKLDNFIMQSDALIIVDCINDYNFFAVLNPMVNNCKILLGEFKFVTLMHVSRLSNVDVHHMVRVSKSLDDRTWIDHISLLEDPFTFGASLIYMTFEMYKNNILGLLHSHF